MIHLIVGLTFLTELQALRNDNTDKYQNISEYVHCTDGNLVFVFDISKDNKNVYTFIK